MAEAEKQPAQPADNASGNEKVKDALIYGAAMMGAVLVLLAVRWLIVAAGVLSGDLFWEELGIVSAVLFTLMVVVGTVYGLLADVVGWLRGHDASSGRPATG